MSAPPLDYCVVLRSPDASPTPAGLAQALASARRAPMQDFLAKARRCFGIVDAGLSRDAATALAGELEMRGIAALALPASLLEDPPPAELCSAAAIAPERLSATLDKGAGAVEAPWSAVRGLCAAVFRKIERRTVKTEEGPDLKQRAVSIGIGLATGLPIGFGGGKKAVEKTVETGDLVYYLDVLLDGPPSPSARTANGPPRRLRVDAQDFDFSGLGARMGLGAAGNFRRLLAEAAERAPEAWRGRGMRALLAGQPLAQLGYESLSDLDAECGWFWTLLRLGRAS